MTTVYKVVGYPAGAGPWGDFFEILTTYDEEEAKQAFSDHPDADHIESIELP